MTDVVLNGFIIARKRLGFSEVSAVMVKSNAHIQNYSLAAVIGICCLVMSACSDSTVMSTDRFVNTDIRQPERIKGPVLVRNIADLSAASASEVAYSIFSDSETGPGTALHFGPRFPSPGAYGAIQTMPTIERTGKYFGSAYQHLKIDAVMAPVADLSPLSPIVGWRSYGDSVEIAQPALTAMIKGLSDGGVIPIIKHYPGHGATRTDSHTTVSRIITSWSKFQPNDLEMFKRLTRLPEVGGVMVAFISAHEGQPDWPVGATDLAVVSPYWMNLLRKDWGFNGLIISDALNMAGMNQYKNPEYYISSNFFKLGGDVIIGNPSEALRSQLKSDTTVPEINQAVINKFSMRIKRNRLTRRSIDPDRLLVEGDHLCQEVAEKALVSLGKWSNTDSVREVIAIPKKTDADFFVGASEKLGLKLIDEISTSSEIPAIAIIRGSGLKLNALNDEMLAELGALHKSGRLAGCVVVGNPLNAVLLEKKGVPSLVCWGPSDCSINAVRRWLNGEIKAEGRWPYPVARRELLESI